MTNELQTTLETIESLNQNELIPENIRLYTEAQVAAILQTSKSYVYQLINCEILKSVELGSIKVRHDTLAEFLKCVESMDLTDPKQIYKLKIA